jgi:VPDSG-CTERM exosortase interaction domain
MNKIKYIAAILIGIAGLGLQQATADFGTPTNPSTLNFSNGQGSGIYGTVTVDSLVGSTATITFTANTALGFYFLDGNIVDVNLNGNSATLVAGSVVENGSGSGDFSTVQYNAQVDGFGKFTVVLNNSSANNQFTTITFQVTNTSSTTWTSVNDVLAFNSNGWDAAAHYIANNIGAPNTFFAGEGGTGSFVPDGGTTVMLLGIGLGALGVVRRYLNC